MLECGEVEMGEGQAAPRPTLALSAARDDENASRSS